MATATLTLLAQGPHSGTQLSDSVAVPCVDGAGGATSFGPDPATGAPVKFALVNLPMTDAVASDTALALTVFLSYSWDGVNYLREPSPYQWAGGTTDRQGNPKGPSFNPSIFTDEAGNAPRRMMVVVDTLGHEINYSVTAAFKS